MFVASQSNGRRKRPVAGLSQQANLKATDKMLPGPVLSASAKPDSQPWNFASAEGRPAEN